jgi:hypothetical protein
MHGRNWNEAEVRPFMIVTSRLRRGVGIALAGVLALGTVVSLAGTAGAATVPSAPLSLTGVAGAPVASATLSWLQPTTTGGGIDTYVYDVATDYDPNAHTGTWSAKVDLQRNTTRAVVPCNAVYPAVCTYRVYARNAAGTSVPTTPLTVAWAAPSSARNLTVKAPNFVDASLAWGAPADAGGLAVRYNVEVSNDNAVTWQALATNINALKLSAPGSCTSGVVCKYRVWARNVAGISAQASKIVLVNVAPTRVRSYVVTHVGDDVTTGNSTSGVATFTINWTPPNIGLHDGPYELQECTGPCTVTSNQWSAIELIPNSTLNVTRTCPANASTCTYRVRATNLRGGLGPLAALRYAPGAPALTAVATGAHGTVNATFGAVSGSGPAILTAHFQFWVCQASCSSQPNWSLSPTTVAYPPTVVPTTAAVTCPTSGASCSVRVQFVNDKNNTSLVSFARTR